MWIQERTLCRFQHRVATNRDGNITVRSLAASCAVGTGLSVSIPRSEGARHGDLKALVNWATAVHPQSVILFFNVTWGNQIPLDEGRGGNETTDAASGVGLIKGLRGRLFWLFLD